MNHRIIKMALKHTAQVLLQGDSGNRGPSVRVIEFTMPSASSSASLKSFAVPIDSVEMVTGIDFSPSLGLLEEKVESSVCIEFWGWK
jgi:DNA/RNA endonuclease G (NUC1)